jgi:hypothetical protein
MSTQKCRLFTNGGGVTINQVVRISAASTVVRALADSDPDSIATVGVSRSYTLAGGILVGTDGSVVIASDNAAPTVGLIAYLSEATLGQVRDTPPGVAGTNQKLRLGRISNSPGANLAGVVLQPDQFPVVSDGAVP